MRIFLFLLILTLTFGCATRNIKYDRNKILEKYSTDYKLFVDNEKVDLETLFLNKDNIENVRIDKRTRELKITQLNPTELCAIKNFKLDSLFPDRTIDLLIIDGIPMTDNLKEKTKIDLNAINSISIIAQEKMNNSTFGRRYDGDLLLITTK